MKKIINNNTNLTEEGVRIKSLAQIAAYSPYKEMRHKAYSDLIVSETLNKVIKRLMKENRELRESTPPPFKGL